ncbi:hypothetical protein FOA52_009051 [Chlamydomonas sp. UWO 241]|nr:hypothetical protein FOA52_009051 [Chlamydomonas sp. UWO 241]
MSPCKTVIVHPRFPLPTYRESSFADLPPDTLAVIALSIASADDHLEDLLSFEQVSKQSRAAVRSEQLWKRLCQRVYSVPSHAAPSSWRALYKFNHEFLYTVVLSRATDSLMSLRLGGLASGAAFRIPVLG